MVSGSWFLVHVHSGGGSSGDGDVEYVIKDGSWSKFRAMGPTTFPLCPRPLPTMIRTPWREGKAKQYRAVDLHRHSQVSGDVICPG